MSVFASRPMEIVIGDEIWFYVWDNQPNVTRIENPEHKTVFILNYIASEGQVKSAIDGYLKGYYEGMKSGAESVRAHIREVLGIPHSE